MLLSKVLMATHIGELTYCRLTSMQHDYNALVLLSYVSALSYTRIFAYGVSKVRYNVA